MKQEDTFIQQMYSPHPKYPDIITVYDHEGTLKAACIIFTLVQCFPVSKSTAEG